VPSAHNESIKKYYIFTSVVQGIKELLSMRGFLLR